MESPKQSKDRYVFTQKPAPGHQLLEKYVETEFRPQDRPQAALAFATAEKLRAQQRRLLKEQADLLDKARVFGFAAAGLEQFIVAQELIVVDLRARVAPSYGIPERREPEQFHVQLNMPSETLRFAVPPITDIVDLGIEPQVAADLLLATSASNDSSRLAGVVVHTPLPPTTAPAPAVSTAHYPSAQPDVGEMQSVASSLIAASSRTGAGASPVEMRVSTTTNREPVPRKSVGWNERSVCKKILGRLPLPYPPALQASKFLCDGTPAFEFREIFGVLPEQIELSLEMDSTHRYGVPTRFVLDPTVDLNIIQLKTVDECVGPANQDGVKQRPIKELYVSWSSMKAVKVEWHTSRMLLRRWVDSEAERNQLMEVPIQASVTNSRSIPVNVQILGAPFAKQYVRSFVLFTESEGAIAIQRGQEIEWWPFRSAAGLLQ